MDQNKNVIKFENRKKITIHFEWRKKTVQLLAVHRMVDKERMNICNVIV